MEEDMKIKKVSASEQVCEAIQDQISAGVWKVGDKLPSESDLAAKFGVNRLTVRMALQKLNALGIVETRTGSGTFVIEFDFESYLKTAYGAQQIEWAGNYGVFRGAERTYSFSLRYEPGLGPDGGLNYEYRGEGYNLAMVTLSLTPHFTVRYDANGGAGYIPEDNATHESGGSVDVLFDPAPSPRDRTRSRMPSSA